MATFVQVLMGIVRMGPGAVAVEDLERELAEPRAELNVSLWKLHKKELVERFDDGGSRTYLVAPAGLAYLRERGLEPSLKAESGYGPKVERETEVASPNGLLPEILKLLARRDDYRLLMDFQDWAHEQVQAGTGDGTLSRRADRRAFALEYLGIYTQALAREKRELSELFELLDD